MLSLIFCERIKYVSKRFIVSKWCILRIKEFPPSSLFLHLSYDFLYGTFPIFLGVLSIEDAVRLVSESWTSKYILTIITSMTVEIVGWSFPTCGRKIDIRNIEPDINRIIRKTSSISPEWNMCRIIWLEWIGNIEYIFAIVDIVTFICISRIITKISNRICRTSKDSRLESSYSNNSLYIFLKIFPKYRITSEFWKSGFELFWCTCSIQNLIFLVPESYASEEILTSITREYISRISTVWIIPSNMNIVTFFEMLRIRTILTFYDIIRIENMSRMEYEPTIETFLIIRTIGSQIAILRGPTSVDEIAILDISIGIIQSRYGNNFPDMSNLTDDT